MDDAARFVLIPSAKYCSVILLAGILANQVVAVESSRHVAQVEDSAISLDFCTSRVMGVAGKLVTDEEDIEVDLHPLLCIQEDGNFLGYIVSQRRVYAQALVPSPAVKCPLQSIHEI